MNWQNWAAAGTTIGILLTAGGWGLNQLMAEQSRTHNLDTIWAAELDICERTSQTVNEFIVCMQEFRRKGGIRSNKGE